MDSDRTIGEKKDNGILPSIRPASDLRTKFTEIMNEIYQSDEPVYLTRKGRCDTVIMNADTFTKYELTHQALMNKRAKISAKLYVSDKRSNIRCSFCNKKQEDAEKIVMGPKEIYICDECIELCVEIISEDIEDTDETETQGE